MADGSSTPRPASESSDAPRAGPAWGNQPATSVFKGRHWFIVLAFFMVVNAIDAVTDGGRQHQIRMAASEITYMAQSVVLNDPERFAATGTIIGRLNLSDTELMSALQMSAVSAAGIDSLLQSARGMPGVAPMANDLQRRFDDARNPGILRQIVDVFRTNNWMLSVAIPAGLAVVFLWLFFHYRRKDQRRTRGECLNCGYDLRESPGFKCPECGAATFGATT